MSEERITVCDVCRTKGHPSPGGPWASMSIRAGWYGPHKYLSGPRSSPNESVSKEVDVCSSKCAVEWLQKQIARIEENVKHHAQWDAEEREREKRLREEADEAERRRRRPAPISLDEKPR